MTKNGAADDKEHLRRKEYSKALTKLQAEICKLQAWIKH
jgi:polyphosphate kinase 2 (PPK2 family)